MDTDINLENLNKVIKRGILNIHISKDNLH